MPYSVNVPNSNQSPGLFPAQNNENFQRLRDIIATDHIFTNSSAVNQGTHSQVSLTNRTTPVGLPGVNSILYSMLDANAASQLHFYNGAADYQLTPIAPAPLKVVGSVILAAGATSAPIFVVPPNTQGTICVDYQDQQNGFNYRLIRRPGNLFAFTTTISQPSSPASPTVSVINTNELVITNISGTTRTVNYYIMAVSL